MAPEEEEEGSVAMAEQFDLTTLKKPTLPNGNGNGPSESDATAHDHLVQTVFELGLQNEYLKSQFQGFADSQSTLLKDGPGDHHHQALVQLQETVELLNAQLSEERLTRVAAEEALKHLQVAHSEADAKALDLSLKLTQGLIFFFFYFFLGLLMRKMLHLHEFNQMYSCDFPCLNL